MKIIEIINII